jgi:hypothetical protein
LPVYLTRRRVKKCAGAAGDRRPPRPVSATETCAALLQRGVNRHRRCPRRAGGRKAGGERRDEDNAGERSSRSIGSHGGHLIRPGGRLLPAARAWFIFSVFDPLLVQRYCNVVLTVVDGERAAPV